jgi:hypothetical protein
LKSLLVHFHLFLSKVIFHFCDAFIVNYGSDIGVGVSDGLSSSSSSSTSPCDDVSITIRFWNPGPHFKGDRENKLNWKALTNHSILALQEYHGSCTSLARHVSTSAKPLCGVEGVSSEVSTTKSPISIDVSPQCRLTSTITQVSFIWQSNGQTNGKDLGVIGRDGRCRCFFGQTDGVRYLVYNFHAAKKGNRKILDPDQTIVAAVNHLSEVHFAS